MFPNNWLHDACISIVHLYVRGSAGFFIKCVLKSLHSGLGHDAANEFLNSIHAILFDILKENLKLNVIIDVV